MDATYWNLNCNTQRELTEVNDSVYKCTGKLWTDLATFVHLLDAKMHPAFKEPATDASNPTDPQAFAAISYKFDDFSFKILTTVLSSCPLKQVRFNNCDLTESQLDMLVPLTALEHFSWLQLDWNPCPAFDRFANLLRESSKLQVLSLRACNLSDEAVGQLGQALKNNRALRVLDLYHNDFQDLRPLAEVIDVNRTLEHLNLSDNHLTDASLNVLVGTFGRIVVPDDKLEEYKKKEKELAKLRAQRAKAKTEGEPPVDELLVDEETKQNIFIKNKAFKSLNLSMNPITSDECLRALLDLSLEEFQIILKRVPLTTRDALHADFPAKVVI